jgi:hypothetical protein
MAADRAHEHPGEQAHPQPIRVAHGALIRLAIPGNPLIASM